MLTLQSVCHSSNYGQVVNLDSSLHHQSPVTEPKSALCSHPDKKPCNMEELLVNGQAWQAWTTNDLILDEIFKHLNLTDLKHARLTCRKFAIVGSRALLRNSVIRLSEFIPFIPGFEPIFMSLNKIKLPHYRFSLMNKTGNLIKAEEDLWETTSELGRREYFRISAYRDYLERITVFPTDFHPKKVVIYNFNDLVRLPMPHFASVEELQVVFFKPSEGYSFLNEFHKLLPNLRCLELRYIQPEETPFHHRLHSSLSAIRELTENQPHRLEELSMALPADFVDSDWSFLAKFEKLKVARIRWAGGYHYYHREWNILDVQPVEMHESYLNTNVFGQWLAATKAHLRFSSLNEVSLRFDLSPENVENIQKALAETNLKKLSLEVYGCKDEVLNLLAGLDSKTIASLTNLTAAHSSWYQQSSIEMILKCLRDYGFYASSKRQWTMRFRSLSELGWVHLIMEEGRFTVQLESMLNFCYSDLMRALWKYHSYMFEKFNYGFCRLTVYPEIAPIEDAETHTKNESEGINTEAFLEETLVKLFQKQADQSHFWATRREPQKLLCDNGDFQRESSLRVWNHPPPHWNLNSISLATWSFFHVPASVMLKWSKTIDHTTPMPINNAVGM